MFENLSLKKHTPRWLILLIDLLITIFSIVFAFLLRFNFNLNDNYFKTIQYVVLYAFFVRLALFLITKSYAGIIRYTGTKDTIRILLVVTYSNIFYIIINFISHFIKVPYIIPYSVILIDFFISIFLLTGFRLFVKMMYSEVNDLFKEEKRVVIVGINENAVTTQRVLTQDVETKYRVEAFIDPNNKSEKKLLDGIKFYNLSEIKDVFKKYEISELIIADKKNTSDKKQEIIDLCFEYNVNVLTLPDVKDWINGELSYKQIRRINIEDLLERKPIKLFEDKIKSDVLNKTILVTGAAGSIGREIVIQLTKFRPKKIIVFDQAESPLYDLELELREKLNFFDFDIVIGNVTNSERIDKVFKTFKPNIVYHAAAYKHVPMMENNPSEAIITNVIGTKTVADAAMKHEISKFVMVSTDKAVNPTNVMGASKRIAEIYIQTLQQKNKVLFITTRFGNVLGSNGSVIPRFRQQIEDGGPVTITHPEITRFFMTIPEACQLVLQAGAIGKGGEIFIFDMGKSVKIVDLAKKMIKLSGLTLGKDINLKFTGLRPGEKLYEELLADKENTLPTEHKKIMIAKTREYNPNKVMSEISTLIKVLSTNDNFKIVKQMKSIIPEFISKNSVYEVLNK